MNKPGHNNPPIPLDPKETIKKNINRRKLIVDDGISLFKGVPLPTWIELSLIDVCNRSCSFCPKSDDKVAPDTYQKMSKTLIDKIYDDLKKMKFKGSLALAGYGEPLLHKDNISSRGKRIKNNQINLRIGGRRGRFKKIAILDSRRLFNDCENQIQ